MKLKLPVGTKMKAAPLPLKLLWRLVTLSEQHKCEADLSVISTEEGCVVGDAMTAVNLLIKDTHIVVVPRGPTIFKFTIDKDALAALRTDARAYRCHLAAKAGKPVPEGGPPPPPIPEQERKKFLARVKPMAAKLAVREKEHIAWQLAGCAARVGLEGVAVLVEQILAAEHDPNVGPMADLLKIYRGKRDAVLYADAAVSET